MSGGHFEYLQDSIKYTADDVANLAESNEYEFSEETIAKIKEAADMLHRAALALRRVDWLVSGDDGEESFHERWAEELTTQDKP